MIVGIERAALMDQAAVDRTMEQLHQVAAYEEQQDVRDLAVTGLASLQALVERGCLGAPCAVEADRAGA